VTAIGSISAGSLFFTLPTRALTGEQICRRRGNLPGPTALKRMMAAMVEVFCDSFEQVPRRIVLWCIGRRSSAALRRGLRARPQPSDISK
jgi:hypothetical protein